MPRSFDIAQLKGTNLEIQQLLDACPGSKPLCFDDGEYLVKENDGGHEIYLVLQGAFVVEQHQEQAGQEATPTIIASPCIDVDDPCFVGEMTYFGAGYRTASVRSSGATYVIELTPEHLDIILENFLSFTRILCQQFNKRLKEANEELKRISADNALHVEQTFVDEGEIIFRQGDMADRLYSLVFGSLQWEQDGNSIAGTPIQDFIEPRAFFTDSPYPVTVRASSPSCLASISKSSKEAVIRNYPQLIIELLSTP